MAMGSPDDIEKLRIKIASLEEEKAVLIEDIDELSTKLREEKKERQSLIDRIKQLEEKVEDLTKEVKRLKEELKKHEKIEYHLKAGEVAYCFEQSVCTFVLPQIYKDDDQATIKALLFLLNGTTSEPQKKIISETQLHEAKQRWQYLRRRLNWSDDWDLKVNWRKSDLTLPDELVAIYALEHIRVGDAHPKKLNLREVQSNLEHLKDHLSSTKYDKIENFIKNLPRMMNELGLSNQKLVF